MRDIQFEKIAETEANHFWFVGRERICLSLIDRIVTPSTERILDYGCGTGKFLSGLREKYPDREISGADISGTALDYCRRRGLSNVIDLTQSPPRTGHYDLIICLDVLEHVSADEEMLIRFEGMLKRDGYLFLTVPAYEFLWSGNDNVSEHVRRYTRRQLKRLLTRAGFRIRRLTYYNTFLFFPIVGILVLRHLFFPDSTQASNVRAVHPLLNRCLSRIFGLEKHVLKLASLPFGMSVLAIAQKTGNDGSAHRS